MYRLLNRSSLSKCTFHSVACRQQEWSKTSLKRLKKTELVQLAKDSNLELSSSDATKNEIVIQLLTHQTKKIVGTSTPAIETIKKVNDKIEAKQEMVDQEWVEAFDMKVAHRGSIRKPLDGAALTTKKAHIIGIGQSKPHPFNDNLFKNKAPTTAQEVSSYVPLQDPHPTSSDEVAKANNNIEGMDPQWVEAFELKVGSRGAKRSSNTFSQKPKEKLQSLEEAKIEGDVQKRDKLLHDIEEKIRHSSTLEKKAHMLAEKAVQEKVQEKENVTATSTSRNTLINSIVGSSMLIWYFGGEKSFHDIWHHFM